jgi:ATP-dependent phosphofructokinase / diphosphate-dependent phosphofructokinase
MTKRIGILTSGGDCAGLNAVIRAAAIRAVDGYGAAVIGIRDGTLGLLRRPVDAVEIDETAAHEIPINSGGTFLGTTNRGDPFAFPMPDGDLRDRSAEIADAFKLLRLDGLIGIGGDGSLAILRRLCEIADLPLIGVPKTIDNDVPFTEYAVGHATAVAVATEALDRLQPTAASHSRAMILEVMGRDAGYIALATGIAGGADIVLVPEIPWKLESLVAKIEAMRERGRRYALVVVAEAVRDEGGDAIKATTGRYGGIGHRIAELLSEATGAEARVTQLGHVQRGGGPVFQDRLIASAFGVRAVDLLMRGVRDRMVGWSERGVADWSLDRVVDTPRQIDSDDALLATARALGICLGD